jgi:transcriptional regulator with XRE-family HTH domain
MATKAPNPVDRHVGSRVRIRRMMLSISQTKLGDALGLTFQQVQKYEKGTNRLSASKLQESAHFLQVPVTFFFEGAPSVSGTSKAKGASPSPACLPCSGISEIALNAALAMIEAAAPTDEIEGALAVQMA